MDEETQAARRAFEAYAKAMGDDRRWKELKVSEAEAWMAAAKAARSSYRGPG
jgi:hypothetical protein